ncbi:MAG: inositol monophosphatase [Bacteroidales bacterium]|nr:inositol monophosphatase [Bacteroidales bacterium]
MDINRLCSEVKALARSVGEYLVAEQAELKRKDVEMKGTRDYVTYVDKTAEEMLVKGLQALLPDSGFLTEEGTVEYVEKTYTWIIDPLDGTSNYVHGDTTYSVSIALTRGSETILGVVHDPVVNQMYWATEGGKAYMNDEQLSVSWHASIENGYIGFGIPYSLNQQGEQILQRALKQFRKASFRIKGSAALDLCYVAAGVTDAFFHSGLSPWDVAAGAFILIQAGGTCTDFSGGDRFVFAREMVASNGKIHEEIMKEIVGMDQA